MYTATFAADGEWMLRFPKRAQVAEHLEREIRLLPVLAPALPLPVPRFELIDRPSSGYPHPFVGYRRLSGRPAMTCAGETHDVERLGDTFGAFLAALHTFPVSRARDLGVERDTEHPSRSGAPEVLIHADFFPEHLLVDGGQAGGVIDWGDVALGDGTAVALKMGADRAFPPE